MQFTNPIIPGFYSDPSICRVGEDYYLVTSTFHYFPGVPIFHSRDLVNWEQIGHCLDRASQLELTHARSSMGIFAPTLRYFKGYFYMITTNMITMDGSAGGNFYVRAADPGGPWSDPVWLEWGGIDPSLFCDEDGRVYTTGTNGFSGEEPGIYQAEIDLESGKLLSPRRLIWKGTGGKSPEGPHLYRIQGEYYLMIAEGGTEYGHMVTLARSQQPFGPFESNPGNPILSHRSLRSPIQATGHADLVQAHDGSWWAVCLGIRPVSRRHHLGRETYLAPVHWSEEGWPVIGTAGRIELQMEGPTFLSAEPAVSAVVREHFSEPQLADSWNFLRNPSAADWSLAERPGWLTLKGSSVTLDEADSPAFIGRRQQHMACRVSALLEFRPVHEGDEAGLTVIMNERFHYEIALTRLDGQRVIILRRRIGSLWKVEKATDYSGESVTLEIEADPQQYTFSFYDQTGRKTTLGQGECGLLSSEIAGGFTGVYFGLYATGNGKPAGNPAYFDWFDYVVEQTKSLCL